MLLVRLYNILLHTEGKMFSLHTVASIFVHIGVSSQLYLQEVEVNDEDIIQQLMEHSNANRSTGSTGANSESSRSHSIMQVSSCMQSHQLQFEQSTTFA